MARPRGYTLSAPTLRALLDAKGLTQKDIAERSGLSIQTVSGLYKQDHGASAPTAQAMATAVGCEAEALFPEMSGRFALAEAVSA